MADLSVLPNHFLQRGHDVLRMAFTPRRTAGDDIEVQHSRRLGRGSRFKALAELRVKPVALTEPLHEQPHAGRPALIELHRDPGVVVVQSPEEDLPRLLHDDRMIFTQPVEPAAAESPDLIRQPWITAESGRAQYRRVLRARRLLRTGSFARVDRGRVGDQGGGAVLCARVFEIAYDGPRKELHELLSVAGGVTAVALDEHSELLRHAVDDIREKRRRNSEQKDIVARRQRTDTPTVVACHIVDGTQNGNQLV